MSKRLDSKVAIVTGSSSGIGRAIALAFAHEGAGVICADLRDSSPDGQENDVATHEMILGEGGQAWFIQTDVAVASDMENLIQLAVEKAGRLDIMVNNAGVGLEADNPHPIWDFPEDMWDTTLRVNLKGAFLGCKYAARQMMKQEPGPSGDRGWIVNMGSTLGQVAAPNVASYCSSKHGINGLTKVVALDCAPYRIHCNALCPSWVTTPLTRGIFAVAGDQLAALHPFRGLGTSEEVAKAAVFLACEDNSWITGTTMVLDGGLTAGQ